VVETILRDIQFALRTARKSPGFVITATLMLALGIGANTAIFSIVSGVLLRPLPFSHPDRLIQLNEVDARNGIGPVFYHDIEELRRQSKTIEAIVAHGNSSKSLLDVADPERIQAVWAERGLFALLGVEPMIGRTFREDDPASVVVLGGGLWKRRFGADRAWIGRKITLDREPYTVIGVMPESFQFPYRAEPTELWIPWTAPPAANRNLRVDLTTARLKPGVAIDAARKELEVIASRLEKQYPDTNRGRGALLTPLAEIVTGRVRSALLTLLGAVGLVLFIACANVANLSLVRAARRTHEIAARAALGATRARLVQQLLTESVLLSLVGGLGGLLLASVATPLVLKLATPANPRSWEIGLDWRVFAFLTAASLGTGIASGLLPALTASRIDLQTALRRVGGARSVGSDSPGWGGRRLRDGLVVAEIALSFVLLVSASLLLRGFLQLQSTPVGLVPNNVLTLRITASLRDYSAPGSYGRYLQELEDRVSTIPGVRATGFIQYLPLQNWGWRGFFSISGRTDVQAPQAELRYVSSGYFEALHVPIRSGRLFTDRDTANAPRVILINEALAHRYFENEDPLGRLTDRGAIIGVVGDVRTSRLDRPATPEIYYSFNQNAGAMPDAGVSLVVSAPSQPEALVKSVSDAIHQVNPGQVVYDVKTMERVIANSLADMNLYLWLIGVFAGLAVLLAACGVYGVISYVVTARTQEFGLRLALGARGVQILRLVLVHGSALVACGVILGVFGAITAAQLLDSVLSGVASIDPATLAGVGIVLAVVAIAACLLPARRAMRVDPNTALRFE
jgi:putative ABC transport system permease protein